MKAVLWDEPFSDPDWIFERKLDGVRCLAHRDGGGGSPVLPHRPLDERATTLSSWTRSASTRATDFVVDGEVVAFDSRGITSFSAAAAPRRASACRSSSTCSTCCAWTARTSRGLPLRERKARLRRALRLRRPGAIQPAPQRAGRAALPRRLPEGARGHHRQARRQPLPRHPLARLAQAQVPRRAGARHRRLHRAAGLAHGLRRAAGRLLRGRTAALRRQGRHRLRPRRPWRDAGRALRELERDDPPFADVHPVPRGTHWVEPELVAQIALHRVDPRRPAAPPALPRPARRQAGRARSSGSGPA